MKTLPIENLLPEIRTALAEQRACVIQAPPGAGKTTRVPLALLDAPWLKGRKLIMLEPRRLAARAAAHYMASLLGERLGETVGYRVRMDTRVGPSTRIEVVTEGVLTRLLQSDAALSGYGLVIFDEFHERSLHADLALALCLEARQALRSDLRIAVMSATLDAAPVAKLLGDAPLLTSEGRSFPVTTSYISVAARERIEPRVANVLRRVLAEETGSVLAFLPGGGEIRRVAGMLVDTLPADSDLLSLYGDLPQAAQEAAILPAAAGRRKLVLATSIAETSLTIEGVRVVVDAGLIRVPRFDPVSGMTRLATVRVSCASADQRRGRAGRLEPGVCYRLWNEGERLEAHSTPEILQVDLTELALELAQWGTTDIARLAWLNPPPTAALAQARDLLRELEALDEQERITAHGRRLLAVPLHPRLSHMVVKAAETGAGRLAALIAALVSERDILPATGQRADIMLRLRLLEENHGRSVDVDRQRLKHVRATAQEIARQAGIPADARLLFENAGRLLALAYPDRLAKRRAGNLPRYLLSNGRGAYLHEQDPLGAAPWLAVAELDGNPREARIFLAASVSEAEVREAFATRIKVSEVVEWDDAEAAVRTVRESRLGAIVLETRPMPAVDSEQVVLLMLAAIRRYGLEVLPWTRLLRQWQQRVLFLRRVQGERWPDVADDALMANLEQWLAPYLSGRTRLSQLTELPLKAALNAFLDHQQQTALDESAPTHFTVPTGSRIPIDYGMGETPVLAVRLQELFGLGRTPSVVSGKVPLLLHLLSPAQRPVQVTQDLVRFWKSSYQDVKKDMRGRYPKHYWPDDPLAAEPTRRIKKVRGEELGVRRKKQGIRRK